MELTQKRTIRFFPVFLCLLAIFLIIGGFLSSRGSSPVIVSFMADFYHFWEAAKGESLDKKMTLWDEQFENKHSDFYREIIYAAENEDQLSRVKSERLKKFFATLEDSHVENMKTKEKEMKVHIPEVLEELRKYFPSLKVNAPQYILPSLFTSSGAVRPYKGDMIVYYGLEIISRMDSAVEVKANIFHETFHAFHFENMKPSLVEKYGENRIGCIHQEGPLLYAFQEGLTVLATEKTYSGIPRPGIVESYVPDYESNFILYAEEFLKDLENYDQQKFYGRYFWDPSDDPFIPDKFGYWLGYKIALSLNKEFSIREMAKWDPDKAKRMFSEKMNELLRAQDSTAAIVSFMPVFYAYWEKAKEEPLEKKMSLWDSLFESKYADFYDSVVYRMSGQDPAQMKPRLLKAFLVSLKDSDVSRMEEREDQIKIVIHQAVKDLEQILPEENDSTTHYILPALNLTSGSARPYKRDMVTYYGLETLSRFKREADMKAIIAHETFHVHHFRHLFPYYREKYGEDISIMSALQGEGLLFLAFMEGLTVYAIERLYPDVLRPGLIEKNVPLYEKNFVPYAREFLEDLQNFSYRIYQKYFIDSYEGPAIPAKFGYWLGYTIVKSLAEEHSIQEMMTWLPEDAIKRMKEKIDQILA